MTSNDRYIQAAINKWGGDSDVSICTDPSRVDSSPSNGAWITAFLYVADDELEPEPGPTYVVWACNLNREGTAFGPWLCDGTFTCNEDDVDGRQARANAHEYARSMRRIYPASLLAVKPAGSRPLAPRFNG